MSKMTTKISIKMVNRLFAFLNEDIIKNYDVLFINLNSVLNSMFYKNIAEEVKDPEILKEYIDSIQTIIKEKIMLLFSKDRQIYFYYSSKPSVNSTLYPDWDKDLNDIKFCEPINTIFNAFTGSIAKFAKDFKNIKVIDSKNIESAVVPFVYSKKHEVKNALIVSRDIMDMLSVPKGFHLTDGNIMMKSTHSHASNKVLQVPGNLFHKYLFFVPHPKHTYKPNIPRMGKSNAAKYIISMYTTDDASHTEVFKSKSFKIFDLDEYIRYFKINITF